MWWFLACAPDPGVEVSPGTPDDTAASAGDSASGDTATGDTAPPTEPLPADALLIRGVTVVDATGVAPDREVAVLDGRIHLVRAAGGDPGAAHVIEAGGQFLVPGLVDAHVHLAHSGATIWTGDPLDANLRANLFHGVTTVFDVGGPDAVLALRDSIAAGETLGPHVLATGPFLTTDGSHPCERWPDPDLCVFVDVGNAADAAAARASAGADAIKVALADAAFTDWPTPRLDLDALALITAGPLPVIAHVDADADVIDAVAAGATWLAHPPFAGPVGPEAAAAATRARGVHSTVGAFGAVGDLLAGRVDLGDPDLLVGPGVVENWRWVATHPGVLEEGWAEASATWATSARANLVTLREAGAVVIPGSDAGYYFVPHGVGLHRELAALVELGWTPHEALVAATATAHAALGLEGGLVAAGAPADLLLLTADPVADVGALDAIETVFLAGVPWARESLRSVDLQAAGDAVCLEDADCAADERCDGVDHRCGPACTPTYDPAGSCDTDTWCMPSDGVDDADGVCHEETRCDLYAQDCAPAFYGQACVPLDVDTNTCWYGGPRGVGEACTWDDPDTACSPGLYCSLVTEVCYTLCDPAAADTCPGRERCVEQEAERGVPWFGLCL
jgi:imidazolonepropionase-like amidohydrolase